MATVSPAAAGNNAASVQSIRRPSSGSTNPSGIDWNGLIEVAVMAKLARADSIDVKVTKNEAKLAAYQNMQSLLADMMDAAQSLRAPSGFSNKDTDVFQSRAAYLTGNGAVDVNASMSATIENGADVGKFDVKILELARAHKIAGSSHAQQDRRSGLYRRFLRSAPWTGTVSNLPSPPPCRCPISTPPSMRRARPPASPPILLRSPATNSAW